LALLPEIILNGTEQVISLKPSNLLSLRSWTVAALIVAFLLIAACSEPAVAEFSVTSNSGNAPFDVSFTLGENADADSFSWDFGDGGGSTELAPSHTFQDAGTFTVRLTATRGDSVSSADTDITVEAGEAGWVVLDGGQESISSFESTQYTATAFDVLGNPIQNPDFNWIVDLAAGDIDESGKFTAGTELGEFENAISVEFERLGVVVSQDVNIEVIKGPLHAFSISPTTLDIQVGRSESFTVHAIDEAGHDLDSVQVLFTTNRSGDIISTSGLFTASREAIEEVSELITIEVELDGNIIEASVSGVVHPGILDQVHVSSLPSTLMTDESFQLTSRASDRFGNELELDEIIWTVSDPSIGTITESGLFTAGSAAGKHTEDGIIARGVLNGVESVTIAPLTIVAGVVESVHIIPSSDSVPIGAGSPFVVLAIDEYGNILDIDDDEYVYEYSSGGRGNEVAVFIAGYELGNFENAITVTLPAGVAGNEGALVAQSDITVRQRSSNIIAVEVDDQDGGGILLIDLETALVGPADPSFSQNGAIEVSPTWWPDGSRLVYITDATGSLQIHTLDIDTREIVQLTNVEGGVSMPDISPDGNSIAFVTLTSDLWQLYVADIPEDAAANPITLDMAVRISDDDTAQHFIPSWSPDGTRILVSQNRAGGSVWIMLFDPTNETAPEAIGPSGSVGLGWTTDGTGIHVGLGTAAGTLKIGTLDLETLVPTYVGSGLEFLVAAWSPDDSELAAIDSLGGAGWLIDADNTGLRRVISSDQTPARMSWRPREYGEPVPLPEIVGEPAMLVAGDDPRGPVGALDTSLSYSAVISTDSGDIEIDLFDDLAPMTVENFINLSRLGFYDDLEFLNVIGGFISQVGASVKNDSESPDYLFNDEFHRELLHDAAGVLSMANSGSNTNGSQFFITHDSAEWLDAYDAGVLKNCANAEISCHSVFGRVTAGLEIVTSMPERDPDSATEPGVKILSITIVES
jgi:cyclophilin family peptidyl-prolyl cis-trans isomerase/PKD repeat protein